MSPSTNAQEHRPAPTERVRWYVTLPPSDLHMLDYADAVVRFVGQARLVQADMPES